MARPSAWCGASCSARYALAVHSAALEYAGRGEIVKPARSRDSCLSAHPKAQRFPDAASWDSTAHPRTTLRMLLLGTGFPITACQTAPA